MKFTRKGLKELYEFNRTRGLPQHLVRRIRRMLADLAVAEHPDDLDLPGYRLHPLRGERTGQWSLRVSGNRRIVFRFEDGAAVDVDLVDDH